MFVIVSLVIGLILIQKYRKWFDQHWVMVLMASYVLLIGGLLLFLHVYVYGIPFLEKWY